MQEAKIELIQLDKMLREGCSQKECAAYFNVSSTAVSKARKKLKTHIVRTVALEKSSQVVEAHLDMMGQLRRINQAINTELDHVQEMIEGAESMPDITRLQETLVKLASEIRKQLNSQVEIFEAARDFKAFEDFKNAVIEVLNKFEPGVRHEVIKELKENRLLRGLTQID